MVKYYYDVQLEAFKREDNRGKPLYVNVTEANRIVNLINLGHSVPSIMSKVKLSNPLGTNTTVKSFIKNYHEGNITIPTDAPAPVRVFESLTDSDRLDAIENRMTDLENKFAEIKSDCSCTSFAGAGKNESKLMKVKKWLKF